MINILTQLKKINHLTALLTRQRFVTLYCLFIVGRAIDFKSETYPLPQPKMMSSS